VATFLPPHPTLPPDRNGMAYVLFMEGIPFIYYGAEQGFLEERPPL
jgi:glycosidase